MNNVITKENIKDMIYEINDKYVMLDSDLSILFKAPTRAINQAVQRNIKKFPKEFSFKLNKQQQEIFWSQFVTKNKKYETRGGRYKNPRVFTEQGIIMLASVLKSNVTIQMSINIVNVFVEMRKFINHNNYMFNKIIRMENQVLDHDNKINVILDELQGKKNLKNNYFLMDKFMKLIVY